MFDSMRQEQSQSTGSSTQEPWVQFLVAVSLSHFPIPHTIKHVSTGRGASKVSPRVINVLLYGGASKVSPEGDQCALGFTVWC